MRLNREINLMNTENKSLQKVLTKVVRLATVIKETAIYFFSDKILEIISMYLNVISRSCILYNFSTIIRYGVVKTFDYIILLGEIWVM